MTYREGLDRLLHSRKFWLAVLAMVQTIVFQFFPQVDQNVWLAINGVIVVLITSITIDDVVEGAQIRSESAPEQQPSQVNINMPPQG